MIKRKLKDWEEGNYPWQNVQPPREGTIEYTQEEAEREMLNWVNLFAFFGQEPITKLLKTLKDQGWNIRAINQLRKDVYYSSNWSNNEFVENNIGLVRGNFFQCKGYM